MARNRKSQSAAVRLVPAIKALFLCLVVGGSGIGYVWQKNQIRELGAQRKKLEVALEERKRLNKKCRDALNELQSPRMLEARIKKMNLGLVLPQQSQIVRLPEPPPMAPAGATGATGRAALYAKHNDPHQASP